MTTSAPITLRIYNYDKAISETLVGQTSLGFLITEAMLQFYSIDELNSMQRGQSSKFLAILRSLMRSLGDVISTRTDIYNYFAKNGNRSEYTEFFGVVNDEDAQAVRELAYEEVVSRA